MSRVEKIASAVVGIVLVAGVVFAFHTLREASGMLSDTQRTVNNTRMVDVKNGGVVPPCAHEWSAGPCYWDAETMGNGTGRSFVVDAYGTVTYE